MRFRGTIKITALFLILISSLVIGSKAQRPDLEQDNRVAVKFNADEAEAALNILTKRKSNLPITDGDWKRLFSTEGYLRLKKREAGMQRSFEDSEFKTFILSDELLTRSEKLAETLERWRQADLAGAAEKALAYLPKDAQISGTIYPTIKPRMNSFVFELASDPAIFLYLDPEKTREQFENTVAHEFHHIGYARTCSTALREAAASLSPNKQTLLQWIGAFGEGFAMLAAAGGADVHPHKFSKPEDRQRWDRDVSNFDNDLRKVEKFFLDVLNNRLNEQQTRDTAFSFFGEQGPWYTVGWKMGATIERAYGRARLIECICDRRQLLPTYNSAAKQKMSKEPQLALLSKELLDAFQ